MSKKRSKSCLLGDEIGEGNEWHERSFTLEKFTDCAQIVPEMMELLQQVGFPANFIASDVYDLLDKSGDNSLTETEFVTGMPQLVYGTGFQQSCLLQLGSHHTMKAIRKPSLECSCTASEQPSSPAKNFPAGVPANPATEEV